MPHRENRFAESISGRSEHAGSHRQASRLDSAHASQVRCGAQPPLILWSASQRSSSRLCTPTRPRRRRTESAHRGRPPRVQGPRKEHSVAVKLTSASPSEGAWTPRSPSQPPHHGRAAPEHLEQRQKGQRGIACSGATRLGRLRAEPFAGVGDTSSATSKAWPLRSRIGGAPRGCGARGAPLPQLAPTAKRLTNGHSTDAAWRGGGEGSCPSLGASRGPFDCAHTPTVSKECRRRATGGRRALGTCNCDDWYDMVPGYQEDIDA